MGFENLRFDNSYARLPERFHTRLKPTPPKDPVGLHVNAAGAALIGLDMAGLDPDKALAVLGGYEELAGMAPLAAVYAGHQFGHFVPQLGDGRAMNLGEVVGPRGRHDLNLKGSGKTPYSRQGDGRAVIRSTVREYLIGEAFAGLGIPTSRSLCMVTTNERVWRETIERSATMIRLAPSFVRFGTFEFFHYRGDWEAVKILADHVIAQHKPHLVGKPERYILFYYEIVQKTAELMADWLAAGWIHGVMNTDNMSILGLTSDYGPYGFLNGFDKGRVWNHTDHAGRYAYDQQPHVGFWNLKALGHALSSLLTWEQVDYVLQQYWPIHRAAYAERMARRIGIHKVEREDMELITLILSAFEQTRADYHHGLRDFYHQLSGISRPDDWKTDIREVLGDALWRRYVARVNRLEKAVVLETLRLSNPKFVLRNHHADHVIERVEADDFSILDDWLKVLHAPFEEHEGLEHLARAPEREETGAVLSCSS